MKRKELLEELRKQEEITLIRKRNVAEFWTTFTKSIRPWLHELTRAYKEKGDFPVFAAWLLPSYYTDPNDVKIAAMIGLLVMKDSLVVEHVSEIRSLIGEHPYEWFRNREFVPLSIGMTRNKRTGGINNGKLSAYLGYVYDGWNRIEECIQQILIGTLGTQYYYNKLHMLRLILGTSDGLGRGVWAITPSELKSPGSVGVTALLKTFFPNYANYFNREEAVHLFGFEKDSDFFYAALAYEELRSKIPAECSRFATIFHKRYMEGNIMSGKYWSGCKGILPKIEL